MTLTEEEIYQLTRQYDDCNGGLILVNGIELQDAYEYYVDKSEVIHMINNNFAKEDSIFYFSEDFLMIYNKSDGYYFGGIHKINESKVQYVICPLKADDKYKIWFKDIMRFLNKKVLKHRKKEHINIICHDECCQTWDSMDLDLMRMGEEYTECTIDYCDYEMYEDTDIANLVEKIMNDWDNVKTRIEDIINRRAYGYAYKMNGFCMIIEKN